MLRRIHHPDSYGGRNACVRHLAAALLFAVQVWAAGTAAAVQGSVIDDKGKPVAAARVRIAFALPANAPHFAAPPVITGPLATSVTADSQGVFSVVNLAAGEYVACADVARPGLLDPCHWAISAPTFSVTAGKTTAGVKIVMSEGAVVPIHVDDPQGFLNSVSGPVDSDLRIHAVTAKGHHYNVDIRSIGPLGRDYVITVPFGTPISISVLSPHFVVKDQSGKSAVQSATRVTVENGASVPAISYTVAGKR